MTAALTEAEFLDLADAMLGRIETAIDRAELDVDMLRHDGVLEIAFGTGRKIIVNRHSPSRELWIAARSGGFHYRLQAGQWRNSRDDGDFVAQLCALIHEHGENLPEF
jgi:CyaY protein